MTAHDGAPRKGEKTRYGDREYKVLDLDTIFDDDRAPGAVVAKVATTGPAHRPSAHRPSAQCPLDVLTEAERALFPPNRTPPADWLKIALAIRAAFDGELVAVTPGPSPDDLPADWRVWFEDRAAIREYDGGQAREHAEAEALRETLDAMREAGENLSDTI